MFPSRAAGSHQNRRLEDNVDKPAEDCYLSPIAHTNPASVREMSNQRRHMSETSADLREISISNLEARLNIEMKHPIKKFGGLNSIRMCGRRARIILG